MPGTGADRRRCAGYLRPGSVGGGMRRALCVCAAIAVWGFALPAAASAAGDADSITRGSALVHPSDIGATGLLTPSAPATVAAASQSLTGAFTPDGRHLYLASAVGALSLYAVAAAGTLTPKTPPTVSSGGTGGFGVVVTPDGKS